MKKTALLFALFFLCLIALVAEAGPVRVVSQTVGTDELLLAVADPSQIAALSHLAQEPAFSAVAAEAKKYPQLPKNCDLEGALKFAPTLLLCSDYSRAEIVAQARRAGMKVIVLTTTCDSLRVSLDPTRKPAPNVSLPTAKPASLNCVNVCRA